MSKLIWEVDVSKAKLLVYHLHTVSSRAVRELRVGRREIETYLRPSIGAVYQAY
jgi:hypothetical protein